MPVFQTYTTNELARYMHNSVPKIAAYLDWTVDATPEADPDDAGSYSHPINEVLRRMRLDDPEQATTADAIGLLLLHAKFAVWEYAVSELTTAYDVGGLAQTLSRGQMWTHAVDGRDAARAELEQELRGDTLEALGFIQGIPFSQVVRVRTQWGVDSPWSDEA